MDAAQLHMLVVIALAISSVVIFVALQFFVTAAYGRHDTSERAWWWGPGIPTRLSWIIMEAPSTLGFAVIFFMGERAFELAPLVLFAMWQAHYFQRTFIYPFMRSVKPGGTTPALIPLSSLFTNSAIAFTNAAILSWATIGMEYDIEWLTDPRFLIGTVIFAIGYYINRKADAMLSALRARGGSGYRIPYGWLYERISCPNYLGEIIIWAGWAIATWSWAGAVFLLLTIANLLPRALSNHAWYLRYFRNYPEWRKAIIPGLL